MKSYKPYVSKIENITSKLLISCDNYDKYKADIEIILDGQPSEELRSLVPINDLRQSGAFFTHRTLAHELIEPIIQDIKKGAVIADPACGVGDLMLACATYLPLKKDIKSTLTFWGSKLIGYDSSREFVRAAKARLGLLAIHRGVKITPSSVALNKSFLNLNITDSLLKDNKLTNADCIVLNPPYSAVQAPKDCRWTSGLVSQAALFLEKCVVDSMPGTKIVAILPDVLRTGTRYRKWRDYIEKSAQIKSIEIIGQFDDLTDVDVFKIYLVVGKRSSKGKRGWWKSNLKISAVVHSKIEDFFKVNVGSVVPHRHPKRGRWYSYIDAHNLPRWTKVKANLSCRRFKGTTFIPPFVVVRRTSRPGDKYRAVGTIITGSNPVAVENHLIVLGPRAKSLKMCQDLVKVLKSPKTTVWLDERIRCRHLTVSALRSLPWWIDQ